MRLLIVFKVKLESTKRIANADIVVGVRKETDEVQGPLIVAKTIDPNITHPLRMKEVVETVGLLHGWAFTSGTFQAIAWKFGIKANPTFCWKSSMGEIVRYSHETVTFIKRLREGDVQLAKKEYRERNRKKGLDVPATAALPATVGQRQTS